MSKNVTIAWTEDEASTKLEGSLAHFVLTVASRLGFLAGGEIASAAEVEEIGFPEVRNLVGSALFVD